MERTLRDRGSYYNQDECAFCPLVFFLFVGSSEHLEHWLAGSTCWPVCLFNLEIFRVWPLEGLSTWRSKRCKVEQHNTNSADERKKKSQQFT